MAEQNSQINRKKIFGYYEGNLPGLVFGQKSKKRSQKKTGAKQNSL
jgi:hypothetical protein